MAIRLINSCLNNQLRSICQNALELEGLNDLVKAYLPKHLAEYCQVGSFNKGYLTLILSHSEWGTELRYSLPEVRDQLRKEGGLYQLVGIKIAMDDKIENSPSKAKKVKVLSPSARKAFLLASQRCGYEPLKKALLKLAE